MSERHNQNGAARETAHFPEELLTAYALGQLAEAERGEIERMLANPAQDEARQIVAETQRLVGELREPVAAPGDERMASSPDLRAMIEQRLASGTTEKPELPPQRRPWYRLTLLEAGVVVSLCLLLAAMLFPSIQAAREAGRRTSSANNLRQLDLEVHKEISSVRPSMSTAEPSEGDGYRYQDAPLATLSQPAADPARPGGPWFEQQIQEQSEKLTAGVADVDAAASAVDLRASGDQTAPHYDLSSKTGSFQGAGISGRGAKPLGNVVVRGAPQSAGQGQPGMQAQYGGSRLTQNNGHSTYPNYYDAPQVAAKDPKAGASVQMLVTPRIVVQEEKEDRLAAVTELATTQSVARGWEWQGRGELAKRNPEVRDSGVGGEQYESITENLFLAPRQHPLSTFSIDVDTASYANMRRFLTGGSLPPPNAVRIEELVNYFRYDYPQPKGPEPFSVNMETAECPWAESHLLLRVGLKGKEVHRGERPASNLVFLLDVSGSMADENKLPLLKTAMQMFTRELGENDRVSIVTYAGEAGLRLPPTRGHEQAKILAAIESLSSGGSTNGSAGIDLAYEQAKAYFVEGGTNRVILCTDGDLNVGITDDDALVQLIKQKAGGGTFLTVLGFGEGNLKDAKMEKLADNGNGLYAYIDSVREARKVLVEQMTGSTITIAKDVKIQIEFNPAVIASYRLLGYENRVLAAQDFNDDKKDAGEIGAGHTVTALYELVPVGAKPEAAVPAGVEPLKYQAVEDRAQRTDDRGQEPGKLTDAAKSGELLTLKLRYKEPEGQVSKLLEVPLKDRGGKFNGASKDLQFAAAVVSFGMILRGSEHKGSSNIAAVEEIASGAIGEDAGGYRAEFVDLVRKAQTLGAR